MERPITRSLLATFIEYAATDKVTLIEWHRFAVNHYHDEMMEKARVQCVRILARMAHDPISPADRDFLFALADDLRKNQIEA
jgi:hypothetical protein